MNGSQTKTRIEFWLSSVIVSPFHLVMEKCINCWMDQPPLRYEYDLLHWNELMILCHAMRHACVPCAASVYYVEKERRIVLKIATHKNIQNIIDYYATGTTLDRTTFCLFFLLLLLYCWLLPVRLVWLIKSTYYPNTQHMHS